MNNILIKALSRSIAIAIIGLVATYFLAQQVNQQLQNESYLKLENIAKQVSIHFQVAIDKSTNDLQALQAFYSALPKEKTAQDFNHYMQILDIKNRPHIQALSWIPLIKENQRIDFIEKIQQDYPEFIIKARDNSGNMASSENKPFYTPVTYISPYQINKARHGFDLSSNSTRRTSLEYARDNDVMTTTAKITLVQEKENSYGFLIIAPVYDHQLAIDSIEQKRLALLGYVTGVFRINNLMEIAKQQADKEGLILTLLDKDKNSGGILYGKEQKSPTFSFNQEIPDRHWQLDMSPNLLLQETMDSPDIVTGIILSGFIISILLGFSLYALQLSMQRARHINNLRKTLQEQNLHLEKTVAERTQKLAKNNMLLTRNIKELARSNQDLDDFAYVASHDLKAPLRGIDQLVSWIAEDIEDNNFSEVNEHITLMRSRIQRLEYLLNDLLEYSRANRDKHELSKVNCKYLFNEIFELIAPPKGFSLSLEENMPEFFTLSPPLSKSCVIY
ncbi:CHASE domain-containing protein [Psychromonas sp. KJ10-10]|uniref:CHASE domain-containing protein n=1 Tax=Psychromonas sp. KJ10-10 TaxID=3391823 RepID=UPI0039B5A1E6